MPRLLRCRLLHCLTALVVILQLALAQAMVASPDLHQDCHHDAHDPGHQCVVTLILAGGVEVPAPDLLPDPVPPQPPPPASLTLPEAAPVVPPQRLGGVMAHGPPRGP